MKGTLVAAAVCKPPIPGRRLILDCDRFDHGGVDEGAQLHQLQNTASACLQCVWERKKRSSQYVCEVDYSFSLKLFFGDKFYFSSYP